MCGGFVFTRWQFKEIKFPFTAEKRKYVVEQLFFWPPCAGVASYFPSSARGTNLSVGTCVLLCRCSGFGMPNATEIWGWLNLLLPFAQVW